MEFDQSQTSALFLGHEGLNQVKLQALTRKGDSTCIVFRKALGNMVKEMTGHQTRSLELESIRVETPILKMKV